MKDGGRITLALAGDVMTGRGVDQVLPHGSDPVLYEPYVDDARVYVQLAERTHGPIGAPVAFTDIWGDALRVLQEAGADVRVVNLETAVTTSAQPSADKGIHYRMHPRNTRVLRAAGIDCSIMANNHVLDWGRGGLTETLRVLREAGIATVGAGQDRRQAERAAVLDAGGSGGVIVVAAGSADSGIPEQWAATANEAGVNLLPDLSDAGFRRLSQALGAVRGATDVAVVSLHWGGNWGYRIPERHRRFARRLIDKAGVDIVFGHSSHHPKGVELYRGKPIVYGAGDFINDYEGIGGHTEYRPDLGILYLAGVELGNSRLVQLEMVPFIRRGFCLEHAGAMDAAWLAARLNRQSRCFGVEIALGDDGRLRIRPTRTRAQSPP